MGNRFPDSRYPSRPTAWRTAAVPGAAGRSSSPPRPVPRTAGSSLRARRGRPPRSGRGAGAPPSRSGSFETSSSPSGGSSIPSKSVPRPTACGPADLRITRSMWSHDRRPVARGTLDRSRGAAEISASRFFGSSLYRSASSAAFGARAAFFAAKCVHDLLVHEGRAEVDHDDAALWRRSPGSGRRSGCAACRRAPGRRSARRRRAPSRPRARRAMVLSETCETSTSIPSRFISSTTCRPKSVSPSCTAYFFGSKPEREEDAGGVRPVVRVRVRQRHVADAQPIERGERSERVLDRVPALDPDQDGDLSVSSWPPGCRRPSRRRRDLSGASRPAGGSGR